MHKGMLLVAAISAWMAAFTTDASAREPHRAQPVSRPAAAAAATAVEDFQFVSTGPSDDDIAKGALKVIGALVLHEQSKPQADDNDLARIGRGLAKVARDKLIDSAFQDLFPSSKAVERAAVRNLVVLALDGKLSRDRDRVAAYLRKSNPDMADVVEVAEFLILVGQAAEKARR